MKRLLRYFVLLLCGVQPCIAGNGQAAPPCPSCQYLYWTGEEDDDFFNEHNWREALQMPSGVAIQRSTGGLKRKTSSLKAECLPGAKRKKYQICPGMRSLQDNYRSFVPDIFDGG